MDTNTETENSQETSSGSIGRLTPEEHQGLMTIRQESAQLLQKLGEYDVLKARILTRLDVLDQQGQQCINGVSHRLGLVDGQQWFALNDGTIRLANSTQSSQTGVSAPS